MKVMKSEKAEEALEDGEYRLVIATNLEIELEDEEKKEAIKGGDSVVPNKD